MDTEPKSSIGSPTNSKENLSVVSVNDDILKDEELVDDAIAADGADHHHSHTAGSILMDQSSVDVMDLSIADEGIITPSSAHQTHSSVSSDVVDGFFTSSEKDKTKVTIDLLNAKVCRIKEQIEVEQKSQDQYVAEYLRITKSADRTQMNRLKGVFERKNQKSQTTMSQLRRKKDQYQARIRDLQANGGSTKTAKSLREVGANLRGIPGNIKQATQNAAEALVSKPKDIAHRLKTRFGSSDNLENLNDRENDETRYVSGDEVSSNSEYETNSFSKNNVPGLTITAPPSGGTTYPLPSVESGAGGNHHHHQVGGGDGRDDDRVNNQFQAIIKHLSAIQYKVEALSAKQYEAERQFDLFQKKNAAEMTELLQRLQAESSRGDKVEHQLHQISSFLAENPPIETVKAEMENIHHKFNYHLEERTREMQESVGSCQNRLQEMERQQRRLRNNSTDAEAGGNFDGGNIVGKLFNLIMSLIAVMLVISTTFIDCFTQFTQSKTRFLVTILIAASAFWISHLLHDATSSSATAAMGGGAPPAAAGILPDAITTS